MRGDSLRILRADIALEQRRIVLRISSMPRPVVTVIMGYSDSRCSRCAINQLNRGTNAGCF